VGPRFKAQASIGACSRITEEHPLLVSVSLKRLERHAEDLWIGLARSGNSAVA
jgi:hypothetical protein